MNDCKTESEASRLAAQRRRVSVLSLSDLLNKLRVLSETEGRMCRIQGRSRMCGEMILRAHKIKRVN